MMPHDRVQKALETRIIEIAPLAYMRGRTLADAFIILDEAQNATGAQMKMFLTRLGVNSKVVVTGDKTQIDLPKREDSGLIQIERILPGIDGIAFCYLDETDVVRHRLVREIIKAYAEDQTRLESQAASPSERWAAPVDGHGGDCLPAARSGRAGASIRECRWDHARTGRLRRSGSRSDPPVATAARSR